MNYHAEKGEAGESYVYEVAEDVLRSLGIPYRMVQNVIMPFESVFGTGTQNELTAEYDIVVFTPFFVFLFEVKNETYISCCYTERLWALMNGVEVSNPITQNQVHKAVFCSQMNIPRERVITIEVLLENGWEGAGRTGCQTQFANDYVLGKEHLRECLRKIFGYFVCDKKFNVANCCNHFSNLTSVCLTHEKSLETPIK